MKRHERVDSIENSADYHEPSQRARPTAAGAVIRASFTDKTDLLGSRAEASCTTRTPRAASFFPDYRGGGKTEEITDFPGWEIDWEKLPEVDGGG